MENRTITVKVMFYENVRKIPPIQSYRPHFVIAGETEYLGIVFVDLEKVPLGTTVIAKICPMYEKIDYSGLLNGVRFTVREGGTIVGAGVVLEQISLGKSELK